MAEKKDKKQQVAGKVAAPKVSARSVAKATIRAMRGDRKVENRFEAALAEDARRQHVDLKGSKAQKEKLAQLRHCEELYATWEPRGVTWAKIVQAVKTQREDLIAGWATKNAS